MFQTSSICTRVKSYLDLDLNQEYDGEITEYISTVKIFCTNIFRIFIKNTSPVYFIIFLCFIFEIIDEFLKITEIF